MPDAPLEQEFAPLSSLTRAQRRVLGVLIEKAFTTPEYYPLTLKAVTTGCNQKNNRHPLASYDEDDVHEVLDQLRGLGLVAVVHTETGRTERYRHWMRRRFTFSEPQLAILGELLLRGRQAIGELRGRASRMSPIETLEQLRDELQGLLDLKSVQADGPLDRRGVEVDHALYEPREQPAMTPRAFEEDVAAASPSPAPLRESDRSATAAGPPRTAATNPNSPDVTRRLESLEATCAELRTANHELRGELASLRSRFESLNDALDNLRRALGE